MIDTLQTARLKLVPLAPAYCDLHLKLHTNPDVLRWLDRAPCAGIEQSKQVLDRLEKANHDGTGACWIVVDSSLRRVSLSWLCRWRSVDHGSCAVT